MAEVVLFHHAQGLTEGVRAFADDLRGAGHTVHTPDLYEGRTFDALEDGVDHGLKVLGVDEVLARGRRAAEGLPAGVVYAGFSLGTLPAQALAQTKAGARGALFFHGGEPPADFGSPWPDELPLQVHWMEGDPWYEPEQTRLLLDAVPGAELFLYPGEGHLFADRSLGDYDEAAAALLTARVLDFLGAPPPAPPTPDAPAPDAPAPG